MKRLGMSLGFLAVFALGCATASVLVGDAGAAPSGSQRCVAINIRPLVGKELDDPAKLEAKATTLPPGWIAVGGTRTINDSPAVVACRTVP